MRSDDGVLLVFGSGLELYRGYMMASAAQRAAEAGHALWLFNGIAPTWQRAHVAGTTVLDIFDHDRVADAARRIAAERPVVGVLAWDEPLVIPGARVARELGLRGLGADGVLGCRDKHRTRRLLTAAGLPQPRFTLAATVAEARAAAADIGYPVVVKPRALGASIGVVRADDERALDAAFRVAADAGLAGDVPFQGGALVEEFVDAHEVSVDGVVHGGAYTPMYVAHKTLDAPPYFEELGHVVDGADPLLDDPAFTTVLADAHRVLGVEHGVTHTEIKLTSRGPVIVEVNGRPGGDLIPYLGQVATGVDAGRVLVDTLLGVPDVTRGATSTVGVRFCHPERDVTVRSVTVPRPDRDAGLLRADVLAEPGSELRLPPRGYLARHSLVVCEARDRATCEQRLDAAVRDVRLDGDPLDAPEAGSRFTMPHGLIDVDEQVTTGAAT